MEDGVDLWPVGTGRAADSTLRPASPMSLSKIPESRPRNRFTIPRWMAVTQAIFISLTMIPLAHGVVPWAISTLLPRYGWVQGSPGFWNRIGLIPVTIAAAVLIWILVLSIAQTPDTVRLGLTPSFLIMRGPYRFTRNPMYVAELGLWLGWALFFGSLSVSCVRLGLAGSRDFNHSAAGGTRLGSGIRSGLCSVQNQSPTLAGKTNTEARCFLSKPPRWASLR